MKKYIQQQENEPLQACEPVAAYQKQEAHVYQIPENELASVMRAKEQYARGEYITHEELEKRVEEWLS
ncbi:hypothetical protein [Bacteroides helcogenes]|uniref:hypothetical protein n=1 Tax=Bacteroides helcogenes TaxID=290053 RepID=UPI0016512931|nr:hypothetical protein [Bacteroides helcogenes]MDY5239701.1 hypothetical protein [Bacteroides helcogenes]